MKTQVACFYETGIPHEVLKLEERELQEPIGRQVLVEMKYAPINPADINILQGRYNHQPELPAVGGSEGVGIVRKTGSQVTSLQEGQIVISPRTRGRWCQYFLAEEAELVALPDGVSLEQAAMLIVNAATAYQLLHLFKPLKKGDWILQNAANSGVGRNVIQLAKHFGIRTVNIVRRPELISEIKELGGDVVLSETDDLKKYLLENLPDAHIPMALNAVGGESAEKLAQALSAEGTLVTFGAMAKKPITIDNKLLIFKNIQFSGFSMRNWYMKAKREQIAELMDILGQFLSRGILHVPVEKRYSLSNIREAIQHAQQSGRSGKILLEL